MMFDVESVGLHGEGFAVGAVLIDTNMEEVESRLFACDPRVAKEGKSGDMEWIEKNIPPIPLTHTTTNGVRNAFWSVWMQWKEKGALMVADCAWPVEARFLAGCVDDGRNNRNWDGPYPLHDLASILLANGKDPLAKYGRLPTELPEHNPLNDARQSARVLTDLWD